MNKLELPEGITIRQMEEELDYLENTERTASVPLPTWLIPAFLVCSAAILFMQ